MDFQVIQNLESFESSKSPKERYGGKQAISKKLDEQFPGFLSDGCPISGSNSSRRQLTGSCESTMSRLPYEDNQLNADKEHIGSDILLFATFQRNSNSCY